MGWKSLVGIYRYSSYSAPDANMIILERNQRLFMQPSGDQGKSEEIREERDTVWIDDGNGRWYGYSEHRGDAGAVQDFTHLAEAFIRIDAGADPAHFYHVTPAQPVSELREKALALSPPAEIGRAHV